VHTSDAHEDYLHTTVCIDPDIMVLLQGCCKMAPHNAA